MRFSLGCLADAAIACGWTLPIGMVSTGGGCGWRTGLVVAFRGSGCKSIALLCVGRVESCAGGDAGRLGGVVFLFVVVGLPRELMLGWCVCCGSLLALVLRAARG